MCRCCRLCWEELYWNCIEEKFCFDESIAAYNPEEDENYVKNHLNGYLVQGLGDSTFNSSDREIRSGNGGNGSLGNNNSPICFQPKLSSTEFYREIQTTVPILAPEVLAAFANSQIFHDHASSKVSSPVSIPSVHSSKPTTATTGGPTRSERSQQVDAAAEDLLKRLEETTIDVKPRTPDVRRASESPIVLRQATPIPEIIEEHTQSDDRLTTIGIDKVDKGRGSQQLSLTPEDYGSLKIVNKNLQLEAPYFSFRPASENDIFTITQSASGGSRISTTPEVPSVSFSNLPKNYLDTPSVIEYRESKSLYEIQTAGISQQADTEQFSMPRYYSKSHLFVKHIQQNINSSSESMPGVYGGSATTAADSHRTPKRLEKSKRLKHIRMQLPPLMIIGGSSSEKSKEGKSTRS